MNSYNNNGLPPASECTPETTAREQDLRPHTRFRVPAVVRAMRPHQWVKNLFVLVPLVFAKELLHRSTVIDALGAFVAFCLVSSAVYVLNDLVDVEADRVHPLKRMRPIASGELSEVGAETLCTVLVATATAIAALLGPSVVVFLGAYLALNFAYSFHLKRIPYVDVLCIAIGFLIRVLCGAFATSIYPSKYLLLVTFALACFLGFGKRMHELRRGMASPEQRRSLERYDERALARCLSAAGILTVVVYVLYVFDGDTRAYFGTDWIAVTPAFTIFGVVRFRELVGRTDGAESPTDAMLRDRAFLLNIAAWAIVVLGLIYRK